MLDVDLVGGPLVSGPVDTRADKHSKGPSKGFFSQTFSFLTKFFKIEVKFKVQYRDF